MFLSTKTTHSKFQSSTVSCNFFMEPCVVVSYGKIFVKIQHMILYVISMTSNIDMATMTICNSDNCSCYYKHSLELTSTAVMIFSFHFGSEITCEISRWVKQVMSRRKKKKWGEGGYFPKKYLLKI